VLIAEADAFVAQWKDFKLPDGRDRAVRHGPWTAADNPDRGWSCRGRRAKVRDRGEVRAEQKNRFTSSIWRGGRRASTRSSRLLKNAS